jgi:hypothetical protein
MTGFLTRNPKVKTLRGKRIESARIKAVTAESIKAHFARLNHPIVQKIPPEHRYNIDETGIMEGMGLNGLVVGSSKRKEIFVKSP